ncbi:MAG TPA: hypothetical protein VNW90_09425 [Acetobacteraceae bacterium]|nr:hypothetical protein [Acetobacteraceae bacterium]
MNDTHRNRHAYAFRPALEQDLPILRRWLRTPEVVRWWGDPDQQAALLRDDLNEPSHGDAHCLV